MMSQSSSGTASYIYCSSALQRHLAFFFSSWKPFYILQLFIILHVLPFGFSVFL
jgi:hypothetical protein